LHFYIVLTEDDRLSLHFPKRSLWCSSVCDHALVFAPTHEYRHASDTWVNSSRMVSNCGQTFDLFMNKGDLVFYVGIYRVHSLRMVHPPGAKIPTDVVRFSVKLGKGSPLIFYRSHERQSFSRRDSTNAPRRKSTSASQMER
jgi:hypothetical protein